MNIETYREICLSHKGVEESFPFDEHTLVFKVMGKMFALVGLQREPLQTNLKCDPEKAEELRELHHQIVPGWHMNKKHWNTVFLEDGLEEALIIELIQHSYDLVVSKLTKQLKSELAAL